MSPEDFCYWLRSHLELTEDDKGMTPEQVKKINQHLDLVMTSVTGNELDSDLDAEEVIKNIKKRMPNHPRRYC